MILLAGYLFPENTACIVCKHVFDGRPIRLFVHDWDGDLQFTCGEGGHTTEDAHVVGLGEIELEDAGLFRLADMMPGTEAVRQSIEDAWAIRRVQ